MPDQIDVQKTVEKKLEPTNWEALVCMFVGVVFGCCVGLGIQRVRIRQQAIENNAAHYELVDPTKPTVRFCWGPAPVKEVKDYE